MLELKNVNKIYVTGDFKQQALNNINLKFRENEFVSILGQSGSGKTTMLNIIGGLDKYTSGDLVINGKSTKKYKDRDWDTYRNHSIGFVFQSYNLIPHQTALENVMLALTLSGVSNDIAKKKSIELLIRVGLKDHINKRPNQMSGGQMQRIAIARALINDPDILLADEPTGALDSETSVQIMELLKEIAKDKLVIMVTHNAELAEEYSSRIVKISDGIIINDTNPFDLQNEKSIMKDNKKTKMSFMTSLKLSFRNLMTKKARTFLTSFAGSIGIIGIALIMSLSNGVQNYIDKVEQDTLSNYPIVFEESSVDMAQMFQSMSNHHDKEKHGLDKIYSNNIIGNIIKSITTTAKTNNLKSFKEYVDSGKSDIKKYSNDIKYGYNLDIQIYALDGKQVNPSSVMSDMGLMNDGSAYTSMMMNNYNIWTELLNNKELLDSQYDVVAGHWPTKYNEVVLMVSGDNEVSDYTLYTLGFKDSSEINNLFTRVLLNPSEKIDFAEVSLKYNEIIGKKFKLVINSDYYEKKNGRWIDNRSNENYMKKVLNNSEDIQIVGIVRPNENAVINSNDGLIGYSSELTEYVVNKVNNSSIAKEQLKNKNIDVFTGKKFVNTSYEENLKNIGIVDINKPSQIYIYPKDFESKEEITKIIDNYNNISEDKDKIQYTDYVGLMMSGVTTIVNIISYVLMAFVSISLIVSSIMIGIITYISVLERTKEIGILRAIGASKKDISHVFNAETFIIGSLSGIIGIGITLLLNIPINIIIKEITDVSGIASLPIVGAIILIIISMLLTVIAGLIPSRIASKKNPVEALRTE